MSKSNKNSDKNGELSTKDWVPVKDIINGVILLKNGTYLKILEVMPINFNLKSKADKRFLILNYRSFLKACKFPMQISVQCKKADVDPHLKRIQRFLKIEKNENVKNMIQGYIKLVSSLSYGSKGAISRRFFLIFPYEQPMGVKNITFVDIEKQLNEKQALIKEFLAQCGNEVILINDNEWVANILYTYLNRRTCEIQKFGGKLQNITGLFLNSELEDEEDDEE